MNREGFESSTESECGGMYSKAAQVRREEVMWDVQTDVNYKCGTKAPAKCNTRRKVRVKEKPLDKKPKRSKVDRWRREGKFHHASSKINPGRLWVPLRCTCFS